MNRGRRPVKSNDPRILLFHSSYPAHCDEQPLLSISGSAKLGIMRPNALETESALAVESALPRPTESPNSLSHNILRATHLDSRICKSKCHQDSASYSKQ